MKSQKTVFIPAISCGHCVAAIKREFSELKGVESVEGDPDSQLVTFVWQEPANWNAIIELLKEIGYPPEL